MNHLKAINRKARRIRAQTGGLHDPAATDPQSPTVATATSANTDATPDDLDVVALDSRSGPHIPLGCSLIFAPGWEVDSTGGTAGLCQPVERDLFDCHLACFWPAHVPDQLNHAPDWTGKCASAQKDWRKIDLIFP